MNTVAEIFTLGARAELLIRLRQQLFQQPVFNSRLEKRYVRELIQIRARLAVCMEKL